MNQATPTLISATPRASAISGNLICMASMLIWAAGFPAAELLLQTWHPLALIAARFVTAMAFLLPLWALIEGGAAIRDAAWRQGLLIGGLAFGTGAWLLLVAQSLTDPVTVAVISAATPVAAVLIELINRSRRMRWPLALGLIASVAGGLVATGGARLGGGSLESGLATGVALAVAACFLFAWGSHRTVTGLPGMTALGRTTVTLAGGMAVTTTLALAGLASGLVPPPVNPLSGQTLILLALYGTAALAISQILWIIAVTRLGVGLAALHINVAPFYVMLILLALGGSWNWQQATGAMIVALGVVLAQRPDPARNLTA